MHTQARRDVFVFFLACRGSDAAEDKFGAQLPVVGDVPGFCHFGINQRVVVLQVSADTGGGKRRPDGVLVMASA